VSRTGWSRPQPEQHSADWSRRIDPEPTPRGIDWVVVFDGRQVVRKTRESARELIRALKKDPGLAAIFEVLES
jgi:hypothetical protein